MQWDMILEYTVKAVIIVLALLTGFAYATLFERRVVAKMQLRYGPNRVGFGGLFQPLADGVKLIFKESIVPSQARLFIYLIAPMISVVVALTAFAVIPIGPTVSLAGRDVDLHLADVNIGILFVLAVASMGVYGIVLGGWSSGNKYSLLGAMRSSAQIISYELSLGLAVLSVIVMAQSLRPTQIVEAQHNLWFIVPGLLAFVVYVIAATAEVNRAPFDLPEAEQELVAGYHTEYNGMRFAMYFMAEYINMITVSSVATTLFLGGWRPLIGPDWTGPIWFLAKVLVFMFVFVWLRASLPRLKYDRLMRLGWQVLLPLSVLNLFVTAGIVAFTA